MQMEFSTQPLRDVDITAHEKRLRTIDVGIAIFMVVLCTVILAFLSRFGEDKPDVSSALVVTLLAFSLGVFFLVYYVIRSEGNENSRPLDYEECAVATRFFEDHPEYGYFIEEVRRHGREMLRGELRALQEDAEDRRKKEACKRLYQGTTP